MKKKTPTSSAEIRSLENKIRGLRDKLDAARAKQKGTLIRDYELHVSPTEKKKLSQLFGRHDEMILIHNMGLDCAYCTLWADGFNGFSAYFNQRCAFVLENDETPNALFRFVKRRKWKFPVVSSDGTSLKDDLGARTDEGYIPCISSLYRDKKGRIYRRNWTELGPGDDFCSIWGLFSMLGKGAKEFAPRWDL